MNNLNIGDFYRFDQDYITATKRYRYKKSNSDIDASSMEIMPKLKFEPELSKYSNVVGKKLKFANSKLLNINFVLSYFFTQYDHFSA